MIWFKFKIVIKSAQSHNIILDKGGYKEGDKNRLKGYWTPKAMLPDYSNFWFESVSFLR